MNGRTCQLCGKALSRFGVGSGGDFCSREHRNQFRLRLGMDRLMEANKVASLMRRRENAKAIPATQLARDSKVGPRVAPIARMPVRRPEFGAAHHLRAVLAMPGIVAHSENMRPAVERAAAAMPAEVRSIEPRVFRARGRAVLPPRGGTFPARIMPAGAVMPRFAGAQVTQLRREVADLRLVPRRTQIGGSGIQVRPLRIATQNCQEAQPARRLSGSADRGRDLRVSGGVGFRLSTPRVRSVELGQPRTNPPMRSTGARALTGNSQPKQLAAVEAGVIRFIVRIPASPRGPKQSAAAGFQWPDALISGAPAERGEIPVTRNCDVRWAGQSPCQPELHYRNGVARFRAAAPAPPSLPPSQARDMQPSPRLTLVTFQPQETPFQCPSDLHGTFLTSMHFGAAPVRKVDSPPATMEEHFDSGLHQWVGGTEDWKVDVAGVRPGSLALYSPSLEIPNYVFEFLTRIEQKGVSWVFRAANCTDYYKATLAVAPGGGYEFRRQAVIGGTAEDATVRPAPPAAPGHSGKTALTVRTRVAGNEFTISIDGQTIDTWTDARLTSGGIGFVSSAEERARLYWVKVTPIGHISKEYSKR
ncbi:MAG TPA: hypothetical protein VMB03_26815 [Bryobacteraceae bacterium]|nr:hypothetical protein [Bryobacteraceae bacterium]